MNKRFFPSLFFSLFFLCTFAQAPTGLNGTGYRTTVHLQWDNYTAFAPVGFNIYRSTVSGSFSTPARQVGAYSNCTDYNLDPSTTYFYKITAFDGAGNESPMSSEITVSTNNNNYSIVASLDLLIPIYTGGMSATAPDEIKTSLEHARQFYFRNTFGQLNLNYHYWVIPGYPPFNSNGQATLATIEADLIAKGVQPSQYDAVHTMAMQLNGFFGGAWYFGGQTAGSMGYDWTHYDPLNHYTQGNSWLFTHEFGHALDLVIAYGSGYPEMLFNHFGDNFPLPPSIGVFDAGSGFDGMAEILRLFPHHLDYDAPWDGYFEVADNDGDGLADNDPRVPMDETRFGSSASKADTDADGLGELAEYYAGTQSSANPNNPDTDGDGLKDGADVYPVSNFAELNQKTAGTVTIDGVMNPAEGWHPMASKPFFSMIPGATLNTFTTWDDNNFYFTFQSNQQLKYFLQMDGSGEDGMHQSDIRFPGGNYANLNENSWGDSYFEAAELIIRSDGTQVYLKEMPVAGSQVSTTFSGGIYTTEVRLPHNMGAGYGWVYTLPGTPVIATQTYKEGDLIGIDVAAIPLSESNGNVAAEWFGYYTKKNIILLNDYLHLYDMELVGGGGTGNYCTSTSSFPWEDWIAKVTFGSINNTSTKTPYSDFTNQSTDMAQGITANISLTTGFSYFTYDEYWKVWIDYNQNGSFEEPSEIAFQGIKNKPPNGTATSVLNGSVSIPITATLGQTRMRVSMKRGAYATPCETIPFGEIEDYTINIIPGMGGEADLELTASANPTVIGSGTVHYTVSLTNKGPQVANNVVVKHTKSGNFFNYSAPTVTAGSFNQLTGVWTLPNITAGTTQTLEFDGLIVDMISQQVDFFETIASSAGDPDSTPNNDNGAKTPDEDDEAAVVLSPATAPDLLLTNLVLPTPNVDPGSILNFTYTVWNAGNWPAGLNGNIDFSFFVSTDNVFSSNDIPSGGGSILVTIPPSGSFPTAGGISAPTNLPEGDYYLIVYLDPNNTILELNEGNNIYSAPFHLNQTSGGTYCISKSSFPWEDWIAKVELSNLSNASGKSAYSDFTAKTADVNAGQSYPVKLTTGYSYFTWDEYWRVWIDLNKDGDFTDAGEMVFSEKLNAPPNGTTTAVLNGNILIPATAQAGTTRMRVSMKRNAFPTPCEALPFGEVEDYSVNIGTGPTCGITVATGNIACQNAGTPTNPNDDTFTFEVLVLGINSQHWLMEYPGGSASGTTSIPAPLGPFLIADFPNGFNFTVAEAGNPTCSTTGSVAPPPPCSGTTPGDYCQPYSNFPWEDWIGNVKLNTLDKTSGKSAYSDFTAMTTSLEKGVNHPINLTAAFSYFTWDEYWSVWIDLNHDFVFSQNEMLLSQILTRPPNGTATKTLTGNITIPSTALNGPTRMRVVMKRGAYATPCESIPFGEIEDYTVNIADQIIGSGTEGRAANISFEARREMTWVNLYGLFNLPENVVQIEIEKSPDNNSFELVNTIWDKKEKGYTHLIMAKDEQPFDGENYYRLLFILENGKEIYSPVRSVGFDRLMDFTLFPNPASSELFIYLNEKPDAAINWKINDAFGRQLKSENINPTDGFPYRININDLKPGMYYLFAGQMGKKAVGRRFVVAR